MTTFQLVWELLGSGAIGHVMTKTTMNYIKTRKALKALTPEKVQEDIRDTTISIDNYRTAEWNDKYLKYCNDKGLHCEVAGDFCTCLECQKKQEKRRAEVGHFSYYNDSYYTTSSSWDSGSSYDW